LRFLARTLLERTRPGGDGISAPSAEVARQSAAALVLGPPLIVDPDTALREAARRMDREQASSVLVRIDGGRFGIVTDSALRSRGVAGERAPGEPVSAAMSRPVLGVGADQTGADVMLTMLDHDIRHVPVFSSPSEVLGVIVAVDLVAAETRSPFVLRRA